MIATAVPTASGYVSCNQPAIGQRKAKPLPQIPSEPPTATYYPGHYDANTGKVIGPDESGKAAHRSSQGVYQPILGYQPMLNSSSDHQQAYYHAHEQDRVSRGNTQPIQQGTAAGHGYLEQPTSTMLGQRSLSMDGLRMRNVSQTSFVTADYRIAPSIHQRHESNKVEATNHNAGNLQKPFDPSLGKEPMRISTTALNAQSIEYHSPNSAEYHSLSSAEYHSPNTPISADSAYQSSSLSNDMNKPNELPTTVTETKLVPPSLMQQPSMKALPSKIPSPWASATSLVNREPEPVVVKATEQDQEEQEKQLPSPSSTSTMNVSPTPLERPRFTCIIVSYTLTHDKDALKVYRRMADLVRQPDVQLAYAKYLLDVASMHDADMQERLSNEAWYWIDRLGAKKQPEALFLCGRRYLEQGKKRRGLRCLERASKAGWVEAHFALAEYYAAEKRQRSKAIAWFKMAAAHRHPQANYVCFVWLLRDVKRRNLVSWIEDGQVVIAATGDGAAGATGTGKGGGASRSGEC